MNGSPQAGAQMLTLLGWGALKHVWNMECFAHSRTTQAARLPHENNTIVVTKDCAAANNLTLHNKVLVAHLHTTQKYRRLCSMFANGRLLRAASLGDRVHEAEARTASITSQNAYDVSE
jgi:hypothetical protein